MAKKHRLYSTRRLTSGLAASAAGLALIASPASAANQYYDTSAVSGLTPGAATWDAGTTSAWATSATPGTAAPTVWTNGNDAFFQTAGTNTVTISGTVIANSVTQTTNGTATTISSGTLQIGSGGLTNSGNTAFTINSAITLGASQIWNAGNAITIGGAIGDGGNGYGITKTGTNTLTFSGTSSNTYTGATLVQAGTLAITGGSGTVTRGASLTLGGGTAGTAATFTDTGVASTTTNDTFTGALNIGTGKSNITLTPNATGQATVTFGSLGTRAAGSYVQISGTFGGTPGVNNTSLIFTTAPTTLVGGGGAINTSTASIFPWMRNASSNHFLGYDATKGVTSISGEATNLTSGATTNVYTNSATALTMTADQTINSLVGDNASANVVMANHTLTVTSGAIMASIGLNIGSDTATAGTLALGSTEGQFSARSNRTLTINSVITGTGGLTLEGDNGSSNIILAGANTYTGVTNMYVGGNVKLTNSLAFQNTTVNFVSGNGMGLIFGNGGTTGQTAYIFGGLSGSQNLNLNNNNTSVGAVALTVGGNGDSTTYSGVLSSTVAGGSLIKTGTGTLTLSGTNTYGGGTTLNDGAIQINNASALGSSGTISFGGGTLKYGTVTTDLSARFSTAASQAYKVDTNGNNVTWATALTSSGGSLVKSGAGTLTTSGANTFSGATTVNSGTLKIASGGALNSSSSISVANGATLENANGGSITPALTLNEGAALTTSAASSSFNPTTLTLTGDLSDGWTAIALTATLGSGLDKTNAALTLTLTGITAGTYNLTSGSGFTGSFSSANINGNALSASGSDWTGTFGGFDYTYTNSTNILSITAVPEPHEFAIAIVALLGVLVFIRRRNQQV